MMTPDELRIRELVHNWAASVRAKNIEGVLMNHSRDILLFDVPEPVQSKGIEAYRDSWMEQFFPWYGVDGEFEVDELCVTAGEDVAFCHGIILCAGTEQGQKVEFDIRLTIGLKKQDGAWIVMHEHHSEALKVALPS